ncbi:cytochrome P450 [Rhodococcus sp. NPDC003348]
MTARTIDESDIDLFSDEVILDPHDAYRRLRDMGGAVWMRRHDCWAITRWADVHNALQDHAVFSSAHGINLNDLANSVQGGVLVSEPPTHPVLRRVLGARLTPRSLRDLEPELQRLANELVDELVQKKTFDAVADFSTRFPLSVVPDLLGCPPDDRDKLLSWAAGSFETAGPLNARAEAGFAVLQDLLAYVTRLTHEGGMNSDGWWSDMLAKARENSIPEEGLPSLLVDFLAPSMDTTINSLSTAVWQFGQNPDQWRKVREDRSLIDNIVDESVRFEAPARGFSRLVTEDVDVSGTTVRKGDRVFISYASGNRDERRWEAPDTFDITRDTSGHFGFGSGIHRCVGQGLAKLEARVLFTALADRVESFEVSEPVWRLNNILRGIESMSITLHS